MVNKNNILFLDTDKVYTLEQLENQRPLAQSIKERWQTNYKIYLVGSGTSCSVMAPQAMCAITAGWNSGTTVCNFYHAPATTWTGTHHWSQCDGNRPLPTPWTSSAGITYTHGLMYSCSIECQ